MNKRNGFTLVELLVVLSIIGVLVSLLLPAVQYARESARRTQCFDNLKNLGLAIHSFTDAQRVLPVGCERLRGTYHSWSTKVLPYMEQGNVYRQFDFAKSWDDASSNAAASLANLSIYKCPSARLSFDGKQDYGGIMGTTLLDLPFGNASHETYGCGVMIATSTEQPRPIALSSITDGLSTTICVAESVDRSSLAAGRWACGLNCFAQAEILSIHNAQGDMESQHPAGVPALFADGHVILFPIHSDTKMLGALCTRNGGEVPNLTDLN